MNAHSEPVTFTIPPGIGAPGVAWQIVVNTGSPLALVTTGAADLGGAGDAGGASGAGGTGSTVVASAAAGSVVGNGTSTGYSVEVLSHAIMVLRATKP